MSEPVFVLLTVGLLVFVSFCVMIDMMDVRWINKHLPSICVASQIASTFFHIHTCINIAICNPTFR